MLKRLIALLQRTVRRPDPPEPEAPSPPLSALNRMVVDDHVSLVARLAREGVHFGPDDVLFVVQNTPPPELFMQPTALLQSVQFSLN
jgi:hypothetical protein